jgi:hypothetical protein
MSRGFDQWSKQVYDELRRMSRRHMKEERKDNTLLDDCPVNEVYLRLVDITKTEWRRAQFFAIAAPMMRRIWWTPRAHAPRTNAWQLSIARILGLERN